MRDHIARDVSTCGVCQKQKKQCKKYGLLLEGAKRKLNVNHGNDYVSIPLVPTKSDQKSMVTRYQN